MTLNSGQQFAWDAVAGADDYEWQMLIGATVATTGTTTGLNVPASVVMLGQGHGTGYKFRVRARETAGPGAYSADLVFDFVALQAPGNVRIE